VSRQRHERRQREQKIRELTAERDRIRGRLKSIEQLIIGNRQETLDIIEEYVNASAKTLDADEQCKSSAWKDDGELYELVAHCRWRGVETPEQAKVEIQNEVARRSVGKTDLAVLLSSIDHTAVNMYRTLPDRLKVHEGEALVEAIVERLNQEDFTIDLAKDKSWSDMRVRWIRLGWRGATEETFSATFVRACAERMVEFHTGPMHDVVLDAELAKLSPAAKAKAVQGFHARLVREYALLPKDGDKRYGEVLEQIRGGETEVEALRYADLVGMDMFRAPDPEGEDIETTFNRVLTEEVAPEHRTEVGRSVLDKVKREHEQSAKDANEDRTPIAFGPKFPYSDHALMRYGRIAWEHTYARGDTDDSLLAEAVGYIDIAERSDVALSLFSPKWAVHAFQRLMTSHTFAAALMCSDVQREVLEGIEKQWNAFMVVVPNGMLIADGLETSRILVATYSYGAKLILLSVTASGQVRMLLDEAATLPDLLAGDGSDLVAETAAHRCLVMARRLVAGLLLNLQHPPNFKIREVKARPRGLRREAEPEHRIVSIGKPLEIDCRLAVKEYIEHGPKKGRKHTAPTVQVMVRGHYRRQVCGVGRLERKVIWIEPFWRGPEAALIQTRAAKVKS
jgi:hypothetical protein